MPVLQVRDCPEEIYTKLAFVAKQQHHTIAQQAVILLEKGLRQEHPNIERRRQLLEKINSRAISQHIKDVDAVAFIREDRER